MAKTESTTTFDTTSRPRLETVISMLRDRGANRIRVIEEDDDGRRCLEEGALELQVGVAYDHWGLKERTRRFLTTVDDTVRWQGREWSFDATIEDSTRAPESVVVYDRTRECHSGNGMTVTRLHDATME